MFPDETPAQRAQAAVAAYSTWRKTAKAERMLKAEDRRAPVIYLGYSAFGDGKNVKIFLLVAQDVANVLAGLPTSWRPASPKTPVSDHRPPVAYWQNVGGRAVGRSDVDDDACEYLQPIEMVVPVAGDGAAAIMKYARDKLPHPAGQLMWLTELNTRRFMYDPEYIRQVAAHKVDSRVPVMKHPLLEWRDSGAAQLPDTVYSQMVPTLHPIREVPGAKSLQFGDLFPVLAKAGVLKLPPASAANTEAMTFVEHDKHRPIMWLPFGDGIAARYETATGEKWPMTWAQREDTEESGHTCKKARAADFKERSICHKWDGLMMCDTPGQPPRTQAWVVTLFPSLLTELGIPDRFAELAPVWRALDGYIHGMDTLVAATPNRKGTEGMPHNQLSADSENRLWECGITFEVLSLFFAYRDLVKSFGIPVRGFDVVGRIRTAPACDDNDAAASACYNRHGLILLNPRSRAAQALLPTKRPDGTAAQPVNPDWPNYDLYALLPGGKVPAMRIAAQRLQEIFRAATDEIAELEIKASTVEADTKSGALDADARKQAREQVGAQLAKAREKLMVGRLFIDRFDTPTGTFSPLVPADVAQMFMGSSIQNKGDVLFFAVDRTWDHERSSLTPLLERVFTPPPKVEQGLSASSADIEALLAAEGVEIKTEGGVKRERDAEEPAEAKAARTE